MLLCNIAAAYGVMQYNERLRYNKRLKWSACSMLFFVCNKPYIVSLQGKNDISQEVMA